MSNRQGDVNGHSPESACGPADAVHRETSASSKNASAMCASGQQLQGAGVPGFESLHRELADIRELIDQRLSRDKVNEEAFDRLYRELDCAKRNATVLEHKSLFIDLILLYDRMTAASEGGSAEASSWRDVVLSLRDELVEVLKRRDIEPIKVPSGIYDPRYQKVVRIEAAETAAEDGKVLEVLREGFCSGETVIRPQEIVLVRVKA